MATVGGQKKEGVKEIKKAKEYNPRWRGYVYILFTSLISFTSAPDLPKDERTVATFAISIGAITFGISVIVLVFDRFQCFQCFNYTTAWNGYFEGYTLLFCVLWWIAGLAFLTRADGPAYRALNIYFSSWMAFASSVYTLNEWSADKDIISIQELTGLSVTLKSWYMLFFSSLVVLGSAANLHPRVSGSLKNEASFSIVLSICSAITSSFLILVHYKFFPKIKQGGLFEVLVALVCLVVWSVTVAIVTSDSGIASSVNGQCATYYVVQEPTMSSAESPSMAPDTEMADDEVFIPGSNLYFFSWSCLLSSLNIMVRWKAAQALQFAHAKEDQREEEPESDGDDKENADEQDDDAI